MKQKSTMIRTEPKIKGHGDIENDLPDEEIIKRIKLLKEDLKSEAISINSEVAKNYSTLFAGVSRDYNDQIGELKRTVGSEVKKKAKTDCSSTVDAIKYPRDISSKSQILWGMDNEKTAIENLKTERPSHQVIDNLGIFQNSSEPWIAATPDGLVCDISKQHGGQWGTLEIKCPYTYRDSSISDIKNLFNKQGKIKDTHSYYTQIQGQMGCLDVS